MPQERQSEESHSLPPVMPDAVESRRSLDAWWSLLLALAAMLCNVVFLVNPPVQQAIPWLSLLLAVSALIFLARGIKRVFQRPRVGRGKILSSIVAAVSLFLVSLVLITFFHARPCQHRQLRREWVSGCLTLRLLTPADGGFRAQGGAAHFLPRILVTLLQPRVARCREATSGV